MKNSLLIIILLILVVIAVIFRKSPGSGKEFDIDKSEETGRSDDIRLPFEYIAVPGAKAIETCSNIRNDASRSATPVILGGYESVVNLSDSLEEDASPEEIIRKSAGFDIRKFIQERAAREEPEYYSGLIGKWPGKAHGMTSFTAHTDILSGKPLKKVYIGLIPTRISYEVPAFLNYGGWNDCPAPEEHVGIWRYWLEKYGARIVSVTSDTIECWVENPPQTKDEAMALAEEQFWYCPDIVTQGADSVSALAAGLIHSKIWYFWWD